MTWRGEGRQSRPQKAVRLARSLAASPAQVMRALPGEFRQRYGRDRYPAERIDEAWDKHLHEQLRVPWPCPVRAELDVVMTRITALLSESGLRFGRNSYGWYADADLSLCGAAWCVLRHTRPEVVVETGVAHGVTSRILLEALRHNDAGRLWSIDLPFPFDSRLHAQTGIAVTGECRSRWQYVAGSSRQRLPGLLSALGQVNVFLHDSLHTARNTAFEMEQAAAAMPAGGVMLVDDIKTHAGFERFARRHANFRTLICPHADRLGLFGIAIA